MVNTFTTSAKGFVLLSEFDPFTPITFGKSQRDRIKLFYLNSNERGVDMKAADLASRSL